VLYEERDVGDLGIRFYGRLFFGNEVSVHTLSHYREALTTIKTTLDVVGPWSMAKISPLSLV
jgi:hypothetical protein